MKKIVIIYHGGCRDGFGGAWAAWKKLRSRAEYVPAFDRFVPPRGLKNKEIYLIDYGYPADVTKKLVRENVRVTAIDHHVTAKEIAESTEDYSFSLNHSGAVLAWKYFHPKRGVPVILRCVEDYDLWKWRFPRSKEILAAMDILRQSFSTWNKIEKDLEKPAKRKEYIEKGKQILHYERYLLDELMKGVELVNFAGHKVFAVNAPRYFADDLGNALSRKHGFSLIWSEVAGKVRVSLRSDGSVNVAKIAQKFNGGGHRMSAGFYFSAGKKIPWKLLK